MLSYLNPLQRAFVAKVNRGVVSLINRSVGKELLDKEIDDILAALSKQDRQRLRHDFVKSCVLINKKGDIIGETSDAHQSIDTVRCRLSLPSANLLVNAATISAHKNTIDQLLAFEEDRPPLHKIEQVKRCLLGSLQEQDTLSFANLKSAFEQALSIGTAGFPSRRKLIFNEATFKRLVSSDPLSHKNATSSLKYLL